MAIPRDLRGCLLDLSLRDWVQQVFALGKVETTTLKRYVGIEIRAKDIRLDDVVAISFFALR